MAALLMMDNGKKCPPFLPQCLPDGYRSFYRVIDSYALRDIRNAGTNEIKLGMYLFNATEPAHLPRPYICKVVNLPDCKQCSGEGVFIRITSIN